jgi:hypothetical protein
MPSTTIAALLANDRRARARVNPRILGILASHTNPDHPQYNPDAPVAPSRDDPGVSTQIAAVVDYAVAHGALILPAGVTVDVWSDADFDGDGVYLLLTFASTLGSGLFLTAGWRDIKDYTPSLTDIFAFTTNSDGPLAPAGAADQDASFDEATTRAAYAEIVRHAEAQINKLLSAPATLAGDTASVEAARGLAAECATHRLPEAALDDLVHDVASNAAAATNNEGVAGQLRWLIAELGVDALTAELRRLAPAMTVADRRADTPLRPDTPTELAQPRQQHGSTSLTPDQLETLIVPHVQSPDGEG